MGDWYKPMSFGREVGGTLRTLHLRLKDFRTDPSYRELSGDGRNGEWVMGFPIPPFQREHVWTRDQEIAFIDSARRGLPLGTYTYNVTAGKREAERVDADGRQYYYADLWLLDGMQRMTALQNFFDGHFAVEGQYWQDIGELERKFFLQDVHFAAYETQYTDEDTMRMIYDAMNYGGTAHTESERALPARRPSP
jgi:hypothetical protein|nr:DUF262 domain-containing protein [Neorhizobium tomejilense]